jgi:hypothetical protein
MHIFLSNYWWQRSDIWSQASYRYSILWEAFLDPSDSFFLFANSCWEKCDEKCAYMFNVYRNQLSRQTGSRNLKDPKTLPTIWHIYMKHVTQASYRYSILWEAFLDPSDSFFLFADLVGFYAHWAYMHIVRHIFLGNYWWQKFSYQ